jgi:AcrR family transcriptional regulator
MTAVITTVITTATTTTMPDPSSQTSRKKINSKATEKNPQATRERIIQALVAVMAERGVIHLTFDAVAAASGVSKGGLLHHFPTKLALLRELIVEDFRRFDDYLQHLLLDEPPTPGRWLRAYIRATFLPNPSGPDLSSGVASALMAYPELLADLKAAFDHFEATAQRDGLPSARASAIRLACDGLWMAEITGMSGVTEPNRSALMQELLALATLEGHPESPDGLSERSECGKQVCPTSLEALESFFPKLENLQDTPLEAA